MNTKRIIVGGLLAGLIITIGETVLNLLIIGKDVQASLHQSPMGTTPIGVFVLRCLVLGAVSVLLYAAMRPRLGPGPKSAITAGILVFLIGTLFPAFGLAMNGVFPARALLTAIIWGAIELPLATVAGAWLYREETSEAQGDRSWRRDASGVVA